MLIDRRLTFIGFALLSFMAMREIISNFEIDFKHRSVLFWGYLLIPFQYYFAYKEYFQLFTIFIPVIAFFIIPIRTILTQSTQDSLKVVSYLTWTLMISVFAVSHIPLLLSLPPVPGHIAGNQGFVLFLIFLSQLNDVLQYLWGKLLKGPKILPQVSPNKTWSGFIGGLLTTTALSFFMRDLLPLTTTQTFFAAFIIALFGFLGDINISMIKRDLSIRNMSDFIPGHGGIMERLDSLSFSALAFYYVIYYWIYT